MERTPGQPNLAEQVIDRFNRHDFSSAVASLKMLQDQDKGSEPQQWQRHIAAINANVDLQKLGVNNAGQILEVNNKGELVTGSANRSDKQTRAADGSLSLLSSSPLQMLVDRQVVVTPHNRELLEQMSGVDKLQREAQTANLPKLGPGDHQLSLTVDGQQREYDVHVPKTRDGRPLPVVFALHGAGPADAPKGEMASEAGLNRLADERGFIAVYPYAATHEQKVSGTAYIAGRNWDLKDVAISYHSWNSSGAGMNETRPDYDDLNYMQKVRDNVARQFKIDPERQYLLGFSEGGEFASHLAARMPVAGIASIHGTLLGTELPPTRPTAFLSITSEHDGVLPRDGSPGKYHSIYPRLNTSQPMRQFDTWRAANGCAGHPDAAVAAESMTLSYDKQQCTFGRPVVDINRFTGRHTIDGNYTVGSLGAAAIGEWKDHSFDAGRTAVDFLLRQRLYPM